MDGAKVDRLARAFAKTGSRRWLVALAGGAIGVLGQRVAFGSQFGPPTCGVEGAVCTLVSGCCDGFTCVTSAINTSYGICVPGEGGMVSTGTTLISPFSETAVEEVSALVQTDSTTTATDPQAEQEARIAATKARRDAKSTKQRTRLDTKRSAQRLRKDERKAERRAKRSLRPRLKVDLLSDQADGDSELDGDQLVSIEVVKVTNRDDASVVLTRIESILDVLDGVSLSTPEFTLEPGDSYLFVSGLPTANATSDQFRWKTGLVCSDTAAGAGYQLKAAFSPDAKNYSYMARCDDRHKKKKR